MWIYGSLSNFISICLSEFIFNISIYKSLFWFNLHDPKFNSCEDIFKVGYVGFPVIFTITTIIIY
jgi:hypothetical protein